MIGRYTLPEMGEIWSDFNKKGKWLEVEKAVLRAKEEKGDIPSGTYNSIKDIKMTEAIMNRADELEKTNDHDLIAFVLAVTENLKDEARQHFHAGLTSYDVEDTALSLQLQESLESHKKKLNRLCEIVHKKADEHKYTLQIGRTHFIHAQPITFGFKLLGWYDVLLRHYSRIIDLIKEMRVGKMSGAVGTYTLDPKIEKIACNFLMLRPAEVSTQILSRDLLVRLTTTLVGVANSLDRFSVEIRHLSGTDLGETAEYKKPGAKGSSAMPGKKRLRNPIKSENICGLAIIMRCYISAAYECEKVWNERSLENSSAERIYLPDINILLDFMLERFTSTIEKLEVFPEQMERNIWKTGGIVFAQDIMLELVRKGMERSIAYDLVESCALSVELGSFKDNAGRTFREIVFSDQQISLLLTSEEIERCFDPNNALKYIDAIFARFENKF